MSRLVQAAKHYGCAKKRYKFELHIHRVVLPSEKRKLFARVLWRGRKKPKHRHHTKWCEGVEVYNVDERIQLCASLFINSNSKSEQCPMQSKLTKLSLHLRARSAG